MKKLTTTFYCLFLSCSFSFAQLMPVTGDLVGVAGVEVDDHGNAWVTETGSGANNGQVIHVKPNGEKHVIITGLPSATDPNNGETGGPWRSMLLPNNRLAVIVGEGPTSLFGRIMFFNLTGFQMGVSAPKTVADTTSTIEISSFALAQPGVTNSNPFSAVVMPDRTWYVVDAGANMIVKVAPDGVRSVFARFPKVPNPTPIGPPMVDAVPTKILANPDGGFYVSILTGFPFNEGKSIIYNVDKNGELSVYHQGLTMITDMAFDTRTGDIYAMQFGNFAFNPSPGFVFGSGKVHRVQRGGGFSEVVASNFGPGSGLTLDDNNNLYATSLFTGQLLKMNSPTCSNIDLSLTSDNNQLTLYGSIKLTLQVTNKGSSNATNVRVYWLPPYKRFEGDSKPFAYQSAYASKGHYDSWHGYWTIDNLAPGETATANFHLFVLNDQQSVTLTAEVAGCNQQTSLAPDEIRRVTLLAKPNQSLDSKTYNSKNYSQAMSVSPNPAKSTLNVAVENSTENEWSVQLLNMVGQSIFNQKGQYSQNVSIDVSNLNNGLYLMEYQSAGERKVQKVLIQH